eukprot:g300.t1
MVWNKVGDENSVSDWNSDSSETLSSDVEEIDDTQFDEIVLDFHEFYRISTNKTRINLRVSEGSPFGLSRKWVKKIRKATAAGHGSEYHVLAPPETSDDGVIDHSEEIEDGNAVFEKVHSTRMKHCDNGTLAEGGEYIEQVDVRPGDCLHWRTLAKRYSFSLEVKFVEEKFAKQVRVNDEKRNQENQRKRLEDRVRKYGSLEAQQRLEEQKSVGVPSTVSHIYSNEEKENSHSVLNLPKEGNLMNEEKQQNEKTKFKSSYNAESKETLHKVMNCSHRGVVAEQIKSKQIVRAQDSPFFDWFTVRKRGMIVFRWYNLANESTSFAYNIYHTRAIQPDNLYEQQHRHEDIDIDICDTPKVPWRGGWREKSAEKEAREEAVEAALNLSKGHLRIFQDRDLIVPAGKSVETSVPVPSGVALKYTFYELEGKPLNFIMFFRPEVDRKSGEKTKFITIKPKHVVETSLTKKCKGSWLNYHKEDGVVEFVFDNTRSVNLGFSYRKRREISYVIEVHSAEPSLQDALIRDELISHTKFDHATAVQKLKPVIMEHYMSFLTFTLYSIGVIINQCPLVLYGNNAEKGESELIVCDLKLICLPLLSMSISLVVIFFMRKMHLKNIYKDKEEDRNDSLQKRSPSSSRSRSLSGSASPEDKRSKRKGFLDNIGVQHQHGVGILPSLLICFLLGWNSFSVVWVFVITAARVYFGLSEKWEVINGHFLRIGEHNELLGDGNVFDVARALRNQEDLEKFWEGVPMFVKYPDWEHCSWLNIVVQRLWPFIRYGLNNKIRETIESKKLEKMLPKYVGTLRLEMCDFGRVPIYFGGIKGFSQAQCDSHEHPDPIIDISLDWVAHDDMAITFALDLPLGVGTLRFGVTNLGLKGILRLKFGKHDTILPGFGEVELSFLSPPEITFSVSFLTERTCCVSDMPVIKELIEKIIHDLLESEMIWPNGVQIDTTSGSVQGLDQSKSKTKEVDGALHVDLIQANDLINADTLTLSDPFVVMYVDEEDKFTSKVVWDSLQPQWNEKTEFLVTEPEKAILTIEVYDFDEIVTSINGKYDFLGKCEIPLEDIPPRETQDLWRRLYRTRKDGKRKYKGSVHIKLKWDPYFRHKVRTFNMKNTNADVMRQNLLAINKDRSWSEIGAIDELSSNSSQDILIRERMKSNNGQMPPGIFQKHGILKKRHRGQWRRYYFIMGVTNCYLDFYKNKTSALDPYATPEGRYILNGMSNSVRRGHNRIILSWVANGYKNDKILVASDTNEADEWIAAINNNLGVLKQFIEDSLEDSEIRDTGEEKASSSSIALPKKSVDVSDEKKEENRTPPISEEMQQRARNDFLAEKSLGVTENDDTEDQLSIEEKASKILHFKMRPKPPPTLSLPSTRLVEDEGKDSFSFMTSPKLFQSKSTIIGPKNPLVGVLRLKRRMFWRKGLFKFDGVYIHCWTLLKNNDWDSTIKNAETLHCSYSVIDMLLVEFRDKKNLIVITWKNGKVTKWQAKTKADGEKWTEELEAARQRVLEKRAFTLTN